MVVTMSKFVIAIDAGHGVNGDSGATHRNGRREADDTFRIANAINAEAKKRGIATVMTRTAASSGAIDRAGIARNSGAGVFLCVHRNAFNGNAFGFETWTPRTSGVKSSEIAQAVQKRCVAVGVNADRGVKHDANNAFPLIENVRNSGIPAILIEYNFVDNDKDNELFDKNFDGYVRATVDAVEEVFGVQTVSAPKPEPTREKVLFRVQVGAFSMRANAERLRDELRGKGYSDAFVRED